MHYLHLKFRNCGLMQHGMSMGKSTSPHLERDKERIGEDIINDKNFGHDVTNPIPYTLLSNVLHVLCGEIPVPTKRKSLFERIPILDEIARKSMIYYYNPVTFNQYGKMEGTEFFQTQKWHWNSTMPISTTFNIADGTVKTVSGWYNWNMFNRNVKLQEHRILLREFIKSIIGIDTNSLTLKETVYELSKYWGTSVFEEKVKCFISENPRLYSMPWLNVFFNIDASGSNTAPLSSTPITVTKGTGRIKYLNGEIICPIDDENICNAIINNGVGAATLLENGIVYVVGLEKYHPYGSFNKNWEPIF